MNAQSKTWTCEFYGYRSGLTEDSDRLGHDAASVELQLDPVVSRQHSVLIFKDE